MTKANVEPFRRVGSCDGCIGRHPTAYCCTSIDAGRILGRIDSRSAVALRTPSSRKGLSFGTKMRYDDIRFYRLHGLDGSVAMFLQGEDGANIRVRVAMRTRGLEIWSDDGSAFSMDVRPGDDAEFVIQMRCREYDDETRGCRIYGTRPRICRDFPILPSQVANTPCAYRFVPKGPVMLTAPDGTTMELQPLLEALK